MGVLKNFRKSVSDKFHRTGRPAALRLAVLLSAAGIAAASLFSPASTITSYAEESDESSWDHVSMAEWMKYISDDVNITSVNIPGTHDSGTFNPAMGAGGLVQLVTFGELEKWTKCQDETILNQLIAGCRYLDIRVDVEDGELMVKHGPFYMHRTEDASKTIMLTLYNVLDSCGRFLDLHPSECVLVGVTNESDSIKAETRAKEAEVIESLIALNPNRYAVIKTGDVVPTMKECRGKIIFTGTDHGDFPGSLADNWDAGSSDKLDALYNHAERVSGELKNQPDTVKENRFGYSKIIDEGTYGNIPRIVHASAYNDSFFHLETPRECADIVNSSFRVPDTGSNAGWIKFNFIDEDVSRKWVSTNLKNETFASENPIYLGEKKADDGTVVLYLSNEKTDETPTLLNYSFYASKAMINSALDWSIAQYLPWENDITEIDIVGNGGILMLPRITDSWFEDCHNLKEIKGSMRFDQTIYARKMFCGCGALTSLDFSGSGYGQLADAYRMFAGCSCLRKVTFGTEAAANEAAMPSLTFLTGIFDWCSALEKTDLFEKPLPNVKEIDRMLEGTYSSEPDMNRGASGLARQTFEKVTDCAGAFRQCGFTVYDLSDWKCQNVTDMSEMFSETKASRIDISGLNASGNQKLDHAFSDCPELKAVIVSDDWSVSDIKDQNEVVFEKSPKLVGGEGSIPDNTGIGVSAAWPDGKDGKQGLLTLNGTGWYQLKTEGKKLVYEYDGLTNKTVQGEECLEYDDSAPLKKDSSGNPIYPIVHLRLEGSTDSWYSANCDDTIVLPTTPFRTVTLEYKIEGNGVYKDAMNNDTPDGTITVVFKGEKNTAEVVNYTGIYDGKAHSAGVENVPGACTVWWRRDGETEWSKEAPEYTDGGEYKLDCKVEGGDYETLEKECTVKITPFDLSGYYVVPDTQVITKAEEGNTYFNPVKDICSLTDGSKLSLSNDDFMYEFSDDDEDYTYTAWGAINLVKENGREVVKGKPYRIMISGREPNYTGTAYSPSWYVTPENYIKAAPELQLTAVYDGEQHIAATKIENAEYSLTIDGFDDVHIATPGQLSDEDGFLRDAGMYRYYYRVSLEDVENAESSDLDSKDAGEAGTATPDDFGNAATASNSGGTQTDSLFTAFNSQMHNAVSSLLGISPSKDLASLYGAAGANASGSEMMEDDDDDDPEASPSDYEDDDDDPEASPSDYEDDDDDPEASPSDYEDDDDRYQIGCVIVTILPYDFSSNVTVGFYNDTPSEARYYEDGFPVDKSVDIKVTGLNGKLLQEDTDYTVSITKDGAEYTESKPGEPGTYVYTIKGAEGSNYTGEAVRTLKVIGEEMNISAKGCSAAYDGKPHSISVSWNGEAAPSDLTITYSTEENGTYSAENPEFTDPGTYTVYYKAAAAGYYEADGSETVTISNGTLNGISVKSSNGIYDGNPLSIQVKTSKDAEGAVLSYRADGSSEWTSELPQYTEVGEYKVYYQAEKKYYGTSVGSGWVIIDKAEMDPVTVTVKPHTYDGSPYPAAADYQNGNVEISGLPEGAVIRYGYEKNDCTLTKIPAKEDVRRTGGNGTREVTDYTYYFTVSKQGYEDYCGTVSYRIEPADISTLKLSAYPSQSFTCDGEYHWVLPQHGSDILLFDSIALDDTSDLIVQKEIGNYVLRFTGKGNYTGSAEIVWSITAAAANEAKQEQNTAGSSGSSDDRNHIAVGTIHADGSYTAAADHYIVKTANAVSGTWSQDAATKAWSLTAGGKKAAGGWFNANVSNKAGVQYAWFYFDENGVMLTGWQWIRGSDGICRCYYLNTTAVGIYGACFLNGTTPDGYTVDATGAWTVNGVQQTRAYK